MQPHRRGCRSQDLLLTAAACCGHGIALGLPGAPLPGFRRSLLQFELRVAISHGDLD
jgi:hypothetical protein